MPSTFVPYTGGSSWKLFSILRGKEKLWSKFSFFVNCQICGLCLNLFAQETRYRKGCSFGRATVINELVFCVYWSEVVPVCTHSVVFMGDNHTQVNELSFPWADLSFQGPHSHFYCVCAVQMWSERQSCRASQWVSSTPVDCTEFKVFARDGQAHIQERLHRP